MQLLEYLSTSKLISSKLLKLMDNQNPNGSAGNRLFVAGLPFSFSDEDLAGLFVEFGKVISAKIIMDRDTGKSKGFFE